MSFAAGTLAQQQILPRHGSEVRRTRLRRLIPALLVFCALVAEVSVRISILHMSYELEESRSAALKNDARLRQLRFEVASLTGPSELAERAKKNLGLGATAPQRVRRMSVE